MAWAAVVSFVARTNRITVAAYAHEAGAMRQDHPRRAAGRTARSATAATPDLKLATCHSVRVAILIAAPPVENSSAAPTSSSRLRAGPLFDNGEDFAVPGLH